MIYTQRYRLYPSQNQIRNLENQLGGACDLYNAAIQERRDAWAKSRNSVNYYSQAAQLKEIRKNNYIELENCSCAQNVLKRVDNAFKGFFRRVKPGEKPGYPRFKSKQRFNSITFPVYGDGIKLIPGNRLRIMGAGIVKIKLHREIKGEIRAVIIKRDAGKWYALFSVKTENETKMRHFGEAVGIDVGLTTFATLSNGDAIKNPRHQKKAQAKIRRAQRKVARRRKGSRRHKKAIIELQKCYAHIREQRKDFQFKTAKKLTDKYSLIAIEDLSIKGLSGGMLAKSVNDAAWGSFFKKLIFKAERAGCQIVKVNPRGTSQRCSNCGNEVRKELKDRWHKCACGLSIDRDLNSAKEILRLGLSLVDLTWNISSSVSTEAVNLTE